MKIIALALAPCLAGALTAQGWCPVTTASQPSLTPVASRDAEMVFDVSGGRPVLFGGMRGVTIQNSTWEYYGGVSWGHVQTPVSPPARYRFAMAYDAARSRTMIFGGVGINGVILGDTWEYDGVNWTQRFPTSSPPARWGCQMVYDPARGVCILFGGKLWPQSSFLDDTWEWDGSSWKHVVTASAPPRRNAFAMAHDPVRRRTVVHGGEGKLNGITQFHGDTWEYDGTNWQQVNSPATPGVRRYAEMAWDGARNAIVLMGGLEHAPGASQHHNDCWIFDGSEWTDVSSVSGSRLITQRMSHCLCFDSKKGLIVLYGGLMGTTNITPGVAGHLRDLWELKGNITPDARHWQRTPTFSAPTAQRGYEVVFDSTRGRTVLFGGDATLQFTTRLNETWEYDGFQWTQVMTPNSPPPRTMFAMAHDASRANTVIFGGLAAGGGQRLADTWTYDGTTWTHWFPTASPAARDNCYMVYDQARGVCVLHGGSGTGGGWPYFNDTWEWNGSTWTQILTPNSPQWRRGASMAYDAIRGRTVLSGGQNSVPNPLSNTWEYDGTDWTYVATAHAPLWRPSASMIHDSATGEMILVGAESLGSYPTYITVGVRCWTYDGTDWTDVTKSTGAATIPLDGGSRGVCYDSWRKTVVFLSAGYPGPGGTWELPSDPSPWTAFGAGCGGSAGVPALSLPKGSEPAIGSLFSLELTGLPMGPGVAFMITGFDKLVWNGIPLPLDLGPYGLPWCTLYAAPYMPLSGDLLHGGNSVTWTQPIPNVPALQGLEFYNQAVSIDPAAPNGKAAFSNAGKGVVQ